MRHLCACCGEVETSGPAQYCLGCTIDESVAIAERERQREKDLAEVRRETELRISR